MSASAKPTASPSVIDSMLSEFRDEVLITKRILARVPAEKLMWKPHPKSMTLGQLAIHIATVPGSLAKITQQDFFDASTGTFVPPQPVNLGEIHAAFDDSIRVVEDRLSTMTEQMAEAPWRLMLKDKELLNQPRRNVLRTIMLNHWYHHRGQLSVYLRLLDIPLPIIYGRSADESPF